MHWYGYAMCLLHLGEHDQPQLHSISYQLACDYIRYRLDRENFNWRHDVPTVSQRADSMDELKTALRVLCDRCEDRYVPIVYYYIPDGLIY